LPAAQGSIRKAYTMAVRNKQRIKDPNGATITYFAAAASDQVLEPGSDCVLHIKNASAGSINATIVTPNNLPNGDAYPDKVVAIPAATEKFVQLGNDYADSSNLASVNWSATASVTWAALTTS
jgi:hypothetical protein